MSFVRYSQPHRAKASEFQPGDLIGDGKGGHASHANGKITVSEPRPNGQWHLEWSSYEDRQFGNIVQWTGLARTTDERLIDNTNYVIHEEP